MSFMFQGLIINSVRYMSEKIPIREHLREIPELIEDPQLNQVTLVLRMEKSVREDGEISLKRAEKEPKRS